MATTLALWPVLLTILLTGISKTVSFTIDSVDKNVIFNASHLVVEEVQDDSIGTSSENQTTPQGNSRGTLLHDETTLKNEHEISTPESSIMEDAKVLPTSTSKQPIPTTTAADTSTSTSKQPIPTTTAADMSSSTSKQPIPTTTAADMSTSTSKQPIPTTTAADMSTSTSKQRIPTTTAADMSTSTSKQPIPTTTAADMPSGTSNQTIQTITIEKGAPTNITYKEDMPITGGDEDMPSNKTKNDMPANTTEKDTPTNITEERLPTDISTGAENMIFVRSGQPMCPVPGYKQTPTPTVQTPVYNYRPSNKMCGKKKETCGKESSGCCSSGTNCCPETTQGFHDRRTLKSLEARLERLEEDTKSIFNRLFAIDCSDITHLKKKCSAETFYLDDGGKRPVSVLCDMETDGGKWTVVQRRDPESTPVDFERGWHDYKVGFGNPNTEYWIGLQNLHAWTNTRQYELRIEITDYDGKAAYAHYRRFYVEGEDQGYRLHVSGYRGTAGDALTNKNTPDNFTADSMMFTTYDRDHDMAKNENCAVMWKSGGWWYNCCSWSNLNGPHWRDADGSGVGINWHTWRNKEYLRTSTIMIRPSTYP